MKFYEEIFIILKLGWDNLNSLQQNHITNHIIINPIKAPQYICWWVCACNAKRATQVRLVKIKLAT